MMYKYTIVVAGTVDRRLLSPPSASDAVFMNGRAVVYLHADVK